MSQKTLPLKLCFKGSRDYLHGTDLYEAVSALARRELGSRIDRFQMAMHRFFSRQPDIHWTENSHGSSRPSDAVVDFSVVASERRASGWLSESGRGVDCRVKYDEELISARCSFAENSISVHGETGFLPIEVAISMTKVLHGKRLAVSSGRWIFTKLDMSRLFEPTDTEGLSIILKDNLHGRLTRSDIRVAGQVTGSIYFSLVR